jgi:hypothetical protein
VRQWTVAIKARWVRALPSVGIAFRSSDATPAPYLALRAR